MADRADSLERLHCRDKDLQDDQRVRHGDQSVGDARHFVGGWCPKVERLDNFGVNDRQIVLLVDHLKLHEREKVFSDDQIVHRIDEIGVADVPNCLEKAILEERLWRNAAWSRPQRNTRTLHEMLCLPLEDSSN